LEPKIVEVRVPTPPTATGQNKTWARTVVSVAEKAKSGYDWSGEQLFPGRLVDLPQGTLFVAVGSEGSRKYGEKWAGLYCVIAENLVVLVSRVTSDEWAVRLRDDAREHLALPWRERCAKVLRDEIVYLKDPEVVPQVAGDLKRLRGAAASDFERGAEVADIYGEWRPRRPDMDLDEHKRILRTRLATLEVSHADELAKHEAKVARLEALLAEFEAGETKAPAEPDMEALKAVAGEIVDCYTRVASRETEGAGGLFYADGRGTLSDVMVSVGLLERLALALGRTVLLREPAADNRAGE
jgi:hypothetical protein